MKPMKNSAVHDFILASQDNVRIAATVGDAWPEARDKLVTGFLERLNSRLMKNLTGWESEIDGSFQQRYSGISFWKPGWDDYWLCLQAQEFGERMVFGVMRDKEGIGKRPFNDELFNAIVQTGTDRKSTRLNSSHQIISYAVFCLKKKTQPTDPQQ